MIVSASRRTDIPAYYSDWFFRRLQEGDVLVRNPMNARQIWRVSLSRTVVDGIVFWTKNPAPMLERLGELEAYPFYFHFTLNAYGREVEPNVPAKNEVLVPVFQKLSARVGKERVVWRYDPIFLSDTYSLEYHTRAFEKLARALSGYTEECIVSFLDLYHNTASRMHPLRPIGETAAQQLEILCRFAETGRKYGIKLSTCAEKIDARALGVAPAHCIDRTRLERIGGFRLSVGKDQNQRPECGCAASVDIGSYHTCPHGCLYCYANAGPAVAKKNFQRHDPSAPLLFGEVGPEDTVKERRMTSCKEIQTSLFDVEMEKGPGS